MKRKIIVTINANEKTCGKCDSLYGQGCVMFHQPCVGGPRVSTDLVWNSRNLPLRCAACLAAERKAKEAGE